VPSYVTSGRRSKELSEFEKDEYTEKRLEVFEADEAKLLVELRNYAQHKFLLFLSPAWHFSQVMPMAEFQFRLDRSYGAETGRIPNCAGGS